MSEQTLDRKPERVKVLGKHQEGETPGVLACVNLDTGMEVSLRYWPTHRGEGGASVPNPACLMMEGKCYRVGLRISSRKGYDDEWMVRECEEMPEPLSVPRQPLQAKDVFILAEVVLNNVRECQVAKINTSSEYEWSPEGLLADAGIVFRGMMQEVCAALGGEEKNKDK